MRNKKIKSSDTEEESMNTDNIPEIPDNIPNIPQNIPNISPNIPDSTQPRLYPELPSESEFDPSTSAISANTLPWLGPSTSGISAPTPPNIRSPGFGPSTSGISAKTTTIEVAYSDSD